MPAPHDEYKVILLMHRSIVSLCLNQVWCFSFEDGAYRSRIAIAAEPEQRSRRADGEVG
jgi:hypothetical protein